jgi:DNA repair exonuclease SbcCD ATPase subunit
MEEQAPLSSPRETAASRSRAAVRELQQRAKAALAASRERADQLEADITRQIDELSAALSEHSVAEDKNASAAQREHAEVIRLTAELKTVRDGWLAERQAFESEQAELKAQVEVVEARHRESQEEWRNQLLDFEARLQEQQNSWNEQRTEWSAARTALERERDELQQKFELALKDVQRLRERGAELEHDLARRPEASQADSAELVALRAERDSLVAQVEQLEQRPATQIDPDVDRQLADLQRRFELAVEDVRDLKTKNARLESQLAAAGSRPAAVHDAGAMDWESQKRRLLASLDEHAEDDAEPIRASERVTIKGTIEMTDAVVAEKDRAIAELTGQLENVSNNPAGNLEARQRHIDDLVDADEVIAQHRQRSQELERETEEKLRAAELEISVERAKIARDRVQLEELRDTLESQRQLYESTGAIPPPGAPRRRWLSKLGIDGKDEEK